MAKIKITILFLAVLAFCNNGFAQCCATATPLGGATNIGLVSKNNLRAQFLHRYNYADSYFEKSQQTEWRIVKNAQYNYSMLVVGYGITKKLTADVELGYYLNKSQTYNTEPAIETTGKGLNNLVASLKYGVIKNEERKFELTIGGGIKLPINKSYAEDGTTVVPMEIQPSTYAFGSAFQLFAIKKFKRNSLLFVNRTEINDYNSKYYMFSNLVSSSLFFSREYKHVITTIQLRHDYKTNSYIGLDKVPNTRSHNMYISPQLTLNLKEKWYVTGMVDVPIYRYYYGKQLSSKYSIGVSVVRNFCL